MNQIHSSLMATAALFSASVALAQSTAEVEPNETRANATVVTAPMQPGHTLTGTTTGSVTTAGAATSLDQFRVKTEVTAPGVYRYRLVITTSGAAGHTGSIRGLTQVGATQAPWLPGEAVGVATTTDAAVQTSSSATVPARFNQWYGFGKGEELYYRITGSTTTTAPYTVTLEREPVTVTDIGNFEVGNITIKTFGLGHTTDTDFWVYDGAFNAIRGYGNDDEAAFAVSGVSGALGTTLQGAIQRNFAAGTYYLAISNYNLSNDQPSPSDDDFRTGALMDFPNAVLNSASSVNLNLKFSVTDSTGVPVEVANTKVGPFDVNFFRFTVGNAGTPCPADLNGDGEVGPQDLASLLNGWGSPKGDLNGDGDTNAQDLADMLNAWGPCANP